MKALFMGTPDFAVPSLEALHRSSFEVVGVVCQPDRPAGRGMKLKPPPVKVSAQELGLEVWQPKSLKNPSFKAFLDDEDPDLVLVAAYGRILRSWFLDRPALGCINVHASLLPRLRGASPIHRAVVNGEARSGVTLMKMDVGLDTGDMITQRGFDLHRRETAGSLHDRLAALGGEMVAELTAALADGPPQALPQDDALATHAPKLPPGFGEIDWTLDADRVDRHIRGVTPFPGAYSYLGEDRLKVHAGSPRPGAAGGDPGTITAIEPEGIDVATGEGSLRISRLQVPGKRAMAVAEYLKGHDLSPGTRLVTRIPWTRLEGDER